MTSAHRPEDVRIFVKECVSLAKAGHEVFLVEQGDSYEKNGVHIIGVGEIGKTRKDRIITGAKKVYERALAVDADVYHLHDPELLPYAFRLKKKKKKVVFDLHENTAGAILEKEYIPIQLRKLVSKLYSAYERNACKKFDALVTVTLTQTAFYRTINHNTVEIRNLPIIEKEEVSGEEIQRRRAVAFAGGITEQWNHHRIIRVISDIDDVEYNLCGAADIPYLKSLKQLDGWKKVRYYGMISHSQVHNLLASASIGVAILTPGENTAGTIGTMGNTKIFEEMWAGLPVVCTGFELWKELVEKYHCGICVDSDNEEQIKSAIVYLLGHPDKAREMGENGKKAVEEEYSWNKESEKLIHLYSKLEEDK